MSYLEIVGGGCFLNALIPIFASYLRAFGHTKQPLIATIIGNLVNFALNAVFLFALHKGVQGVATATVISKVINLAIVIFFSCTLVKAGKIPKGFLTELSFHRSSESDCHLHSNPFCTMSP